MQLGIGTVIRALRAVMICFVLAFMMAFTLLVHLVQRIANWARGLLHSD
jgi:hypothetical protein